MINKILFLLVPAMLIPACAGHRGGVDTQEEPIMNTSKTDEITQELMMPDPTDVSSIDAIVKAMYASICFNEGVDRSVDINVQLDCAFHDFSFSHADV